MFNKLLFFNPLETYSNLNLTNSTLFMPAISIGNIGQLCIDLFIASNNCHLIGRIYTSCVTPIVAANPFNLSDKNITTALDVYQSEENNFVIIQQRSPFIKNCREQYLKELLDWVEECNFKEVIVFGSTMACERTDQQIIGLQTRYIATKKALDYLGDALLTSKDFLPLERRINQDWDIDNDYPFIPGSGLSKSLYNLCDKRNIRLVVLLIFAYEADNRRDAHHLLSAANNFFHWTKFQNKSGWITPPSWKYLYGHNLDKTIY